MAKLSWKNKDNQPALRAPQPRNYWKYAVYATWLGIIIVSIYKGAF